MTKKYPLHSAGSFHIAMEIWALDTPQKFYNQWLDHLSVMSKVHDNCMVKTSKKRWTNHQETFSLINIDQLYLDPYVW